MTEWTAAVMMNCYSAAPAAAAAAAHVSRPAANAATRRAPYGDVLHSHREAIIVCRRVCSASKSLNYFRNTADDYHPATSQEHVSRQFTREPLIVYLLRKYVHMKLKHRMVQWK